MPNTHSTLTSLFTDIANAIRAKKGTSADIVADNFPSEIASIPSGEDTPVLIPASIEENGTYEPPVGVDGFSKIIANVPQGVFPSGSITLTEENTYDVTDKAQAVVDFSTTRANLAEAVTAKGVDTLPTASFDTIATNIGLIEGGGGSLPSSISKIDGGSFTAASDTDCRTYNITHNLGVIPKAFVVWTDDFSAGEAQPVIYLVRANYFEGGYNATTVATNLMLRISTNGAMTTNGAGITAANVPTWVTAAKICANYNTNYKAGCTYKWIAWA